MNDSNKIRFEKSILCAIKNLRQDAKQFGYSDDLEFSDLIEAMQSHKAVVCEGAAAESRMVRYYWSEDSDPELCTRKDFTAASPGLCYHCDSSIPVGSEASLLRSADGGYYRMHRTCADNNSVAIG